VTAVPSRALRPYRAPGATRGDAAPVATRWSREWLYFIVVYAGWCFVPLLRRLIDWHNGAYNPITITSTLPFVLTLPLALVAFRSERWKRMSPAFRAFMWIWVATFAYGAIVAFFAGNVFAAIYESIQYLVPMLVGVWLAGLDLETPVIMRRVTIVMLTFGAVVGLYGLAQFVNPAPWDALWVTGGDFTSMGLPLPFQLRIFSTLNSAGPAADFFALAIIVSLPFFKLKRVWIWPFVGILGAALLLTLVRASWIALVVGVAVYLLMSPKRVSATPFIALYAVLLVFLVASLPALLGASSGSSDVVTARLATLGDVGHDDSALARSSEIADSFEEGLRNPIGSGLGQIGASSALSSNPSSVHGNNLDSGYMARFLELGWLGFAGYVIVVLGSLVAMMLAAVRRNGRRAAPAESVVIVATAAAMCAALAWGDAAGDSHLGLDGLFFWIALGVGLRPVVPAAGEPHKPALHRWVPPSKSPRATLGSVR
jgi:hypothetical protein